MDNLGSNLSLDIMPGAACRKKPTCPITAEPISEDRMKELRGRKDPATFGWIRVERRVRPE
jgi:hypothetical protein